MSTAPEQLALFDLGLNLTALRASKERLMQASNCANTKAAYVAGTVFPFR
jgi:hypothetical protein